MEQEFNIDPKERPKYTRGTIHYNQQIEKVHSAANCKNPRTYCVNHHSLETRTTKGYALHKNYAKGTPMNYAGKTLDETEKKFFKLCLKNGFASGEELTAVILTGEDSIRIEKTSSQDSNPKNSDLVSKTDTNPGMFINYQNQTNIPAWAFTNPVIPHSNPYSVPHYFQQTPLEYGHYSFQLGKNLNPSQMFQENPFNPLNQKVNQVTNSVDCSGEKKALVKESENQKGLSEDLDRINKEIFKINQRLTDLENKFTALVTKVEIVISKASENSDSEERSDTRVKSKRRGKKK